MLGERRLRRAFLLLSCNLAAAVAAHAAEHTLIIAGLGGEPEYEARFREQAQALGAFARDLHGAAHTVVISGESATASAVKQGVVELAARAKPGDSATIVLIGHGTFDGQVYRFNLRGPDLTGVELAELFDRIRARRQLIVNATSASGAVAEQWRRPNRIVITATKSGGERTATRFAEHWIKALTTSGADLNKDELVTIEEAFSYTQREVAAAFKADAALATEHARLEGDAPERFAAARFGAARGSAGDPQTADLLSQRGRLEIELDSVKSRKAALAPAAYYDALEVVLVRMARLQQQIDARQAALGGGGQ